MSLTELAEAADAGWRRATYREQGGRGPQSVAAGLGPAAPRQGRDRLRDLHHPARAGRDSRAGRWRACSATVLPTRTAPAASPSDGLPVGPGGPHLLGTDELGRDILVRIIYGAQVSLEVGISAAVAAVLIGVIIGLCAGYFGPSSTPSWPALMDVVLSFPFLLAAIALASVFSPSEFLEIVVISFFSFASVGRIVRGQTLAIREREYVEAARSLGAATCGSCSSTCCRT